MRHLAARHVMTKHVPMGEMRQSQDRRRITLPLAPPLEQRRLQLYIGLLLIDGAAIMGGLCVASWLYLGRFLDAESLVHGQALLPIYWTIALSLQVYTLQALRRINFARARAVLSLIGAESALLFVGFATKSTEDFSRVSAILGLALAMLLLVWLRSLLRPLIKARCGDAGINILLIDDGGAALRVPNAYHIDAREHHLAPDLSDPHMMDRLGLYMMNMDRVMVSCPTDRRSAWALVFKSANVSGEIVDTDVNRLGVIGARRERDYGALIVASGPLGLRARAVKRGLDLALAGSAVLALSPLLLIVALLIKLEDGGPVFFVQKRTGRGNRFFPIFKFRSMRAAHMIARDAFDLPERLWGIFNSSNLANYFELQGHNAERSFVFEPVISGSLRPYLEQVPTSKREKRIVIYGRPNVDRNCFPALIRGLKLWAATYPEFSDWEIVSAGTAHKPVDLGDGRTVTSVGKLSLDDYAGMMLTSSVGVSLMASPHPSYPPLEMSHMGMKVVTNGYLCKDLSTFHPNIISTPTVGARPLATAIARACREADGPCDAAGNPVYLRTDPYPIMAVLCDGVIEELTR